jgi:putative serine protease PepD
MMKGLNSRPRLILLFAVILAVGGGLVGAGILSLVGQSKTTVIRTAAVPSIPTSNAPTLSVDKIYKADGPGVVDIVAQGVTETQPSFGGGSGGGGSGGGGSGGGGGGGNGGSSSGTAEGSGFIYDAQGHIVTNDHVVAGSNSVHVMFSNNPKLTYSAKVIGTDPSTDVAVLQVNAPAALLHPLTIGNSNAVSVGDPVVAIGSPFGLAETVTSGIVSALDRQIQSPSNYTINKVIQTDAAINQGNSGGPLTNGQGQVIGINAQIATDSGDNSGVGFAIPINTVRGVADQIIKNGKVEHAYLGVSIPASGKAVIEGVAPKSPAAKAGLSKGDTIVAVNGTSIGSYSDLTAALSTLKPGDTASLKVVANGKTKIVKVTLANRPGG